MLRERLHMADNIKCFKILQDNVALEKISNEDFLKKIKEKFLRKGEIKRMK